MGLLKKNGNEEDFSRDLLRGVDDDGAEYFTVKATGQSGMSHSGLSRFVGIKQSSVSKLIARIRKADPTANRLKECLKPFAGSTSRLTTYFDPEGRDILHDGLCAAIVKYYAKYYKPRIPGDNIKAQNALNLIEHLGMRVFIHQKTGWKTNQASYGADTFEQDFDAHKGRYSVRQILRFEDNPELKSAIHEYQREHRLSRKVFSDTYDEMNKLLQGIKSRDIKQNNNLSKSALIRDYYDTRPLMDYSAITRLTTNQIRKNVHPVEAVKLVFSWLYPDYVPQPIPLIENVNKADRRLKAEAKRRRLAASVQLSLLPLLDSQGSETQAS
jgi:hypothetical protein